MSQADLISVVIPFYNEQDTLVDLYQGLVRVFTALDRQFEIVFVDDGSSDGSCARVTDLVTQDRRVRLIKLRGNFGKSAALAAGFDFSKGSVVFTMDADLQDDPEEIPHFLAKLEDGYQVVSGYKKLRKDPWHKVYPSRLFNWAVRIVTGVPLHDINCGFKCYRRQVLEEIRVYGELHRFIPVLAAWRRFHVTEVIVEHHPRRFGQSHYGISRLYKGFLDLLTVSFLFYYETRPAHLFGVFGLSFFGCGFLISLYLTVLWFLGSRPIGNRPLFFLGILLIIVGIQVLATGLLAELQTREIQRNQRPYAVDHTSDCEQTEADRAPDRGVCRAGGSCLGGGK
jgi:dolichol-phosphate mannosyltransferase